MSRRTLSGGPGPVVTLTSYGERTRLSYLAIESIARGTLTPARTLLWLEDPDSVRNPPKRLRRLVRRGLEIKITKNYGPHTKYYPFVASSVDATPFVTADDDVVYPKQWLRELVEVFSVTKQDVVTYRARRVKITAGGDIAPYDSWPFSEDSRPSYANFATGHSGVMYPVAMADALRSRGESFLEVCPKADDIWLHDTAVRNQVRIRLVRPVSVAFPVVGATQSTGLKHDNVARGANDTQIAQTYDQLVVGRIRDAVAEDNGAED